VKIAWKHNSAPATTSNSQMIWKSNIEATQMTIVNNSPSGNELTPKQQDFRQSVESSVDDNSQMISKSNDEEMLPLPEELVASLLSGEDWIPKGIDD